MGLGIGNLLPPGLIRNPPKSEPKPSEPVQTAPAAPQPAAAEPTPSAPQPVAATPPTASMPAETAAPRPIGGAQAIAELDETATTTQSLIEAYRSERSGEASPTAWISRSETTFAAPAARDVTIGTQAEIIARAAYSLVVDAGAVDTRRTLIDAG